MAPKMILASAAMLAVAAGCRMQPSAPEDNKAAPAPAPAPSDPIETRYDRTITGQPLRPPPAPFQLLVTQVTYRAGHVIACHQHRWPRHVYVQSGHLRVTTYNPLRRHNFTAGQIVVEAIGQWHEGRAMGTDPLVLVAFDQVPPGEGNQFPWAPPPPTSPCTPPG